MPSTGLAPSSSSIRLAATVGNALEWFDFAVYGYFATDIGQVFFPESDATLQLVAAFGVFAIGYLMRPLGSLVLGPVGDLLGRRAMLCLSVLAMGAASLLIALLPGYAQWGAWAGFALLFLRMVQGFSVGGEYTGSITYVLETSPLGRRGLNISFVAAGGISGFVLGALTAALLNALLSHDQLLQWGWRLPFLFGAVLGVFALWLRGHIPEAPEVDGGIHRGYAALLADVLAHWKPMLWVMAIVAYVNVVFYLIFVFLEQYASSQAPQHAALFSAITTGSEAIGLPLLLLGGHLVDRFGAIPCLRRMHLALALVTIPAVLLIQQASPFGVAAGQLLAVGPVMLILGGMPSLLPTLFAGASRCTGFSLSYSLVVAVLGGTVPALAAWMLGELHWSLGPALYAVVWAVPTLWALQNLRLPAQAR